MQYVGFFLVFASLVAGVVALLQRAKMKKILAAPFRRTGEAASNPASADEKGMISVEGAIQVAQPFSAPISGRPCIHYTIEVERTIEKIESTENGTKKTKSKNTVVNDQGGTVFYVNDGSGPISVDAREKVDTKDMVKSFEQGQNAAFGDVTWGSYTAKVPPHVGEGYPLEIKVTEKIVPAEGNVFALGKLANGVIARPDGMLGKLVLSTKGREKLLGGTKRNVMIAAVAAGVCFVAGTPISIFADAPDLRTACDDMKDDLAGGTCNSRFYNKDGANHAWKVTKAGTYTLSIKGTGSSKMMRLWPDVKVIGAGGVELNKHGDEDGVALTAKLSPGDYKIAINDFDPSHLERIKGGAGYDLTIKNAETANAPAGTTAKPQTAAVGK